MISNRWFHINRALEDSVTYCMYNLYILNIQLIKVKVAPHLRLFRPPLTFIVRLGKSTFSNEIIIIINEIKRKWCKMCSKGPEIHCLFWTYCGQIFAIVVRGSQRRLKSRSDSKEASSSESPSSYGFWILSWVKKYRQSWKTELERWESLIKTWTKCEVHWELFITL